MRLLEKLRYNRAKKQVLKSIKILSKMSWEEIDSIIPRTDYRHCFSGDWKDVELVDMRNGERKKQRKEDEGK